MLTLDADSVLLPEYAARILLLMEQSGFKDVGVAQTPYSAYPGASTRIERIAGATTDLQHIVHQGLTHYDATFWVGANAILRKKALEDICEIDYVGEWEVRRYIQDRTVIEDTESTIDLGEHGWRLYNYPERLAYSATPPDFGSLCIQRQRWANGGLLILSKLWRQSKARRARGEQNRFGEVFLRINYMASIFWSSVCLLITLCYPFNSGLLNPILLLVALPYFFMMASDLRYCDYKRSAVFRIDGFNLMLLAVNLSGSFASMLQLVTGEKSAFKRTPKVRDRTTASAVYVLAPFLLIAFATYTIVIDIRLSRWENLVYATLNASLTLYAVVAFIGLGAYVVDLWTQFRGWLYRPVPPKQVTPDPVAVSAAAAGGRPVPVSDWASILYYGTTDASETAVIEQRPRRQPLSRRASAMPTGTALEPALPVSSNSFDGIDFFTVFQPIRDLVTDETVGFEALTRFVDGRRPDVVLAEAEHDDRAVELDAALIRAALSAAEGLPREVWVSVNVSSALAGHPEELAAALSVASRQVVVDAHADPIEWAATMPPNVTLAVSDAGGDYDSLALVDSLQPAFMKLDRTTVTGIAIDAARQALVGTLVVFAEEHGCQVIAMGVETDEERWVLVEAGVHLGQGYLLGRPGSFQLQGGDPATAGSASASE